MDRLRLARYARAAATVALAGILLALGAGEAAWAGIGGGPAAQGTVPRREANLSLSKDGRFESGIVTFTVRVENFGTSVAEQVVMVDRLPNQVDFVSYSILITPPPASGELPRAYPTPTVAGARPTPTPTPTVAGAVPAPIPPQPECRLDRRVLTCSLLNLRSGEIADITITTKVINPRAFWVRNRAQVSSITRDPVRQNNRDAVSVRVRP